MVLDNPGFYAGAVRQQCSHSNPVGGIDSVFCYTTGTLLSIPGSHTQPIGQHSKWYLWHARLESWPGIHHVH
jgi:hypothetical protein